MVALVILSVGNVRLLRDRQSVRASSLVQQVDLFDACHHHDRNVEKLFCFVVSKSQSRRWSTASTDYSVVFGGTACQQPDRRGRQRRMAVHAILSSKGFCPQSRCSSSACAVCTVDSNRSAFLRAVPPPAVSCRNTLPRRGTGSTRIIIKSTQYRG